MRFAAYTLTGGVSNRQIADCLNRYVSQDDPDVFVGVIFCWTAGSPDSEEERRTQGLKFHLRGEVRQFLEIKHLEYSELELVEYVRQNAQDIVQQVEQALALKMIGEL